SGVYATYPYDRESKLEAVLPEPIKKNKTLVSDITKFIDAGWLDENGRPVPGAKKEQQLALAASMMCDHAGVNKYSELFGSYWEIKPSTMRSNKRNALESVDGASIMMEIKGILG
ncbi:MAG: hypothetical protein IKM73_09270, partial [Acidaminococcaceae bacterium]|nr:hypothetical protein [Acidaminococcaceae bacterium]